MFSTCEHDFRVNRTWNILVAISKGLWFIASLCLNICVCGLSLKASFLDFFMQIKTAEHTRFNTRVRTKLHKRVKTSFFDLFYANKNSQGTRFNTRARAKLHNRVTLAF